MKLLEAPKLVKKESPRAGFAEVDEEQDQEDGKDERGAAEVNAKKIDCGGGEVRQGQRGLEEDPRMEGEEAGRQEDGRGVNAFNARGIHGSWNEKQRHCANWRKLASASVDYGARRIFTIALPFANSSTNLSRYRISA